MIENWGGVTRGFSETTKICLGMHCSKLQAYAEQAYCAIL